MKTPRKRKVILALIGPKGSGKTHIGQVLEKKCAIGFINVEEISLRNNAVSSLSGDELLSEGFSLELKAIDQRLQENDVVSFENTGAHNLFYEFLDQLLDKYDVKLIKIFTPLDECYNRINRRDSRKQIPVADQLVRQINEKAAQVNLKWDHIIDNSSFISDQQIADQIIQLLTNCPG